jgi:hypothetical protein
MKTYLMIDLLIPQLITWIYKNWKYFLLFYIQEHGTPFRKTIMISWVPKPYTNPSTLQTPRHNKNLFIFVFYKYFKKN